MATQTIPNVEHTGPQPVETPRKEDWAKPAAMAIPKEGYFKLEKGRYGAIYPKSPACYGFTIIAKIKPGTEATIRDYGKRIEQAVHEVPDALATLKLHYLRWVLFNIDQQTYFMYQGIFDTDFDKYTEDAVALFAKYGVNTVFENLEGFPEDWKTNVPAFVKFVREHQCPSFLEYGEYPFVSAEEVFIDSSKAVQAVVAKPREENLLVPPNRRNSYRVDPTARSFTVDDLLCNLDVQGRPVADVT